MGGVALAGGRSLEREISAREVMAVGFGVQGVFARHGNDPLSNGAASARRGVSSLELSPAPVNVLSLGRNASLLTTPTGNRTILPFRSVRRKISPWVNQLMPVA